MAACEKHGVIPGKDYARVKAGESVISRTGAIVRPEQVCACSPHRSLCSNERLPSVMLGKIVDSPMMHGCLSCTGPKCS